MREDPVYRRKLDADVPVCDDAALRGNARLDQVCLHAEPVQSPLPGGGAGNEPVLRRDWRWSYSRELILGASEYSVGLTYDFLS